MHKLNSCVIFFEEFKNLINDYFKAKSGLYHYLNTAASNYREYLKGDFVKAKKYFYVIRPILACKWILKEDTPPPMLFTHLVESVLEEELKQTIGELLEMKMTLPEIGAIPKINQLNQYIEENLIQLKRDIDNLPSSDSHGYEQLNRIFLEALELI